MTDEQNESNQTKSNPGVGDFLGMLGGANPMMAFGRALEGAMQLSGEIKKSVLTFNDTITELNKVARRVNAILDEIEGPIKEIIPLVQASAKQAKSTIKKADGVLTQVTTLPAEVTKAIGTLGDLATRLAPLTQFAETAGAMFGIKPSGN